MAASSSNDTADAPRTLALCLEYSILQHGGTEVLVRELIRGLAPHYRLVLVSDDTSDVLSSPELAGRVERHFHWRANAGGDRALELAAQLEAAQVDAAHFHFGGTYGWETRRWNRSPIVHLRRRGVPCLATNHGVFWLLDGYIGAQRSVLTKLALLPFAWASRLHVLAHLSAEVAVSRADYFALRRRYWPLRSRFRQIYHSRLRESDATPGGPREKFVLSVGTIGPRKGQTFLAEAFRALAPRFADWKLVFIGRPGDAAYGDQLQRLIEGTPAIEWRQDCSNEEVRGWYQRSEIFALPSLHEGLGLSLQEALFYGCACVASRVGGILDLVEDNHTGLLVPPASPERLEASLGEMMGNESLRARLRMQGHASVLAKGMTVERMVARYVALYNEVLCGT